MTGRSRSGPADYDGPEWAAPERAERIASRPVNGRGPDYVLGSLCKMLRGGQISSEQFRQGIRFKMTIEQQAEAWQEELA